MDEILGKGSRGGGYEKTSSLASREHFVPDARQARESAFIAFPPGDMRETAVPPRLGRSF